MYGVELYAVVRLAVVEEGLSHREAGRRFGIDRRTVKKMLSYSAPSISVPRGHDVLAFMTLPRYGTIGFGKVRPGLSVRSGRAITRPSWQPRSPSRSAPRRLPRPGR